MAFHANMASSFSLSSKTFLSDFRSNFLSLFSKQLFTRLAMHWSLWWWYQKVAPKSPKHQKKKKFFTWKKKLGFLSSRGFFWLFLRFCWLFCTPVVVDSERLLQWEFLEVLLAPNWYFMSREREEEGKFHLSIVQSRAARKSAQFSVMKAFCACPPRSIFLDCEKSKQLNLNLNLRKNSWVISYQICQVPITWINKCWMLLVSVKNTVVWKALINVSFWHHNC